jgi:hypothetical protein
MNRVASILALIISICILPINSLYASSQGHIISNGNFSLYKGGKLLKKVSGKSLINDDVFMLCDGKCLLKAKGISMAAMDKTVLAVKEEAESFNILVNSGRVEFVLYENSKNIAFHTPDGAYSLAEPIFNASSGSTVRGFVIVDDKGTKVGIREGRMIFTTDDGTKTVNANQGIILAMADVPATAGTDTSAAAGVAPTVAAGTSVAAAAAVRTIPPVIWFFPAGAGLATAAVIINDDHKAKSPDK